MTHRTRFAAIGLFGLGLAGCAFSHAKSPADSAAPTTAPAAQTVKVGIDNFTFAPAVLTVSPGTTVTWTNHDDIPHTATADDNKAFASDALDTDQSFSFTFKTPGEYPYHCAVHPHMTGKIIVK